MITRYVMQHSRDYSVRQPYFYAKKKERGVKYLVYVALSIYGIIIGSVFFAKSLTMYLHHDTRSIISPLAQAEEPKKIVYIEATPTPTQTPTPTAKADPKREYILKQSHGDILLRIWTNETTRGTNRKNESTNLQVYCEAKGQTNEFGYDAPHKYCFSEFNYSVDQVNKWWDTCLASRSLKACLLRYSGNSEDYVEKFLSQSNY